MEAQNTGGELYVLDVTTLPRPTSVGFGFGSGGGEVSERSTGEEGLGWMGVPQEAAAREKQEQG